MNLQRYALLFMVAVLAALGAAIQNNTFPTWTPYLLLAVAFLTHLVQSFTNGVQIPKNDPASKVSTSMRPPPLPMLFVLLVAGALAVFAAFAVAGCKGMTPGEIKNVENVVDFVEQDACVLATDFLPSSDTQTVAEVCGYVQAGTQAAEDIVNRIIALQKSKARAKDPALKAKYAAKLAARKP